MKTGPSFRHAFLTVLALFAAPATPLATKRRRASDRSLADTVDPNFKCNSEMMLSYGLTGMGAPSAEKHKFCPGIASNCCSADDQNTAMYLWTTDSQLRVSRFYEVYLMMVKYLLGYSAEATLLAADFSQKGEARCQKAASELRQMNLNPKLSSVVYSAYAETVKALGDIRRGFFCVLCDAQTQKSLKDFWALTNLFYKDRVYFSRDFCKTLVDRTIQASYFSVSFVKKFAESLGALISCKLGTPSAPSFEVSFFRTQQIKNCFFFKSKYFFFFCENYCERFHLARQSELLDADFQQLEKFFVLIRDSKDRVFYNPGNNILINGFYEERFITNNLEAASKTRVFFPAASSGTVDLSTFQTDVVYTGGMNPWASVENSSFELVISHSFLAKSVLLTMVVVWFTAN